MTEPTVQVPVSLIEDALDAIPMGPAWDETRRALRALLSQSTSTAEPDRRQDRTTFQEAGNLMEAYAEMAPGTKLWCELGRVTVERDASGRVGLRTFTSYLYDLADIDSSTIRDVTPPES